MILKGHPVSIGQNGPVSQPLQDTPLYRGVIWFTWTRAIDR
jgi:hypothetical protein